MRPSSGPALTVLALVGGLMAGFMVGSMTFQALDGRVPGPLTYSLTVLVFSARTLIGSAVWGVGIVEWLS